MGSRWLDFIAWKFSCWAMILLLFLCFCEVTTHRTKILSRNHSSIFQDVASLPQQGLWRQFTHPNSTKTPGLVININFMKRRLVFKYVTPENINKKKNYSKYRSRFLISVNRSRRKITWATPILSFRWMTKSNLVSCIEHFMDMEAKLWTMWCTWERSFVAIIDPNVSYPSSLGGNIVISTSLTSRKASARRTPSTCRNLWRKEQTIALLPLKSLV